RLTLRLANADDYVTVFGSRLREIEEVAGRGYVRERRQTLACQVALLGVRDPRGERSTEAASVFSIAARMRDAVGQSDFARPFRIEALPTQLSYRAMLAERHRFDPGASFVGQLKTTTADRWRAQRDSDTPEWLRAVIGATSAGGARTIRFEAKEDGVHGLV